MPSIAAHVQKSSRAGQKFPLGVTLGLSAAMMVDMAMRDDPMAAYAAAAVEGDQVALNELVRRTQAAVWRLCVVLGSPGEEEDLVQETYLRAITSLPSYRYDAPVQVWLLAIARRVCADHVRRRQRRRRLVERAARHADRDPAPAHTCSDDLLERLDPDRRAAFFATQILGLSYEDAATVLDCPIGTVRSRVSRARGELIAALEQSNAH